MPSWYALGEIWKAIAPVIGIIGGGISGWLLARWQINTKRREQAEQTNQERRALLLLVDSEVTANTDVFSDYKSYIQSALEQHEIIDRLESKETHLAALADISAQARKETVRTLSTATWDGSKTRLAQLLKAAEVEVIIGYYNKVLPAISAIQHIDFLNKDALPEILQETERALKTSDAALQDIARIQDRYEQADGT